MSSEAKLAMLASYLPEVSGSELTRYLSYAEQEILNWLYHKIGMPAETPVFPTEYDGISIQAVVVAFDIAGAESQSVHIENGIHRHFKYTDMVDYIHKNVVSYARVI